jgi:hypothetical protein
MLQNFSGGDQMETESNPREILSSCCFARTTKFYLHELKEAELKIRKNRIFLSDGKTG